MTTPFDYALSMKSLFPFLDLQLSSTQYMTGKYGNTTQNHSHKRFSPFPSAISLHTCINQPFPLINQSLTYPFFENVYFKEEK